MSSGKRFCLSDAILSVICIVFVAEAAAPVAAIGNSQYFWWIFLMLTFLLPYGLISAELGCTYPSEGGIYTWVKKAFGNTRWGARTAWYYWANYPCWMASLAVMFPQVLSTVFDVHLSTAAELVMELVFIWMIVFISFFPVCDSVWILNESAMIKVFLALAVGFLGLYFACHHGLANEYTLRSLLPDFHQESMTYVSAILHNFLGFEIICTFAADMRKPEKEIPRSIIVGGILIAVIYMYTAFGIHAAIPASELNAGSGLVETVRAVTGGTNNWFVKIVAVLFLLTLFGNMVSWALGVNSTVCYAADQGDMPRPFRIRSKKNNMPVGAAVMNGIIASLIVSAAPLIPNQNLFWSFFALNLVMLLLSYIPVFPAFLRLRKMDPDTVRPFRVPGNVFVLKCMVVLPLIMLVGSLIFTAIPLSTDPEIVSQALPITIGSVIFIILGEIIGSRRKK